MWDDRIDEAARELTSGAPGREFRAQVLARIEDGSRGWHGTRGSGLGVPGSVLRARGWGLGRTLALASVAAVVAIAIVMYREGRPTNAPAEVRLSTSAEATAVKKPDTTLEPRSPGDVRLEPDTTAAPSSPPGSRVPAQLAQRERERVEGSEPERVEEPALPDGFESIVPEPLAIAPLEVAALERPVLAGIQALTVTPLEIPALNSSPVIDQH